MSASNDQSADSTEATSGWGLSAALADWGLGGSEDPEKEYSEQEKASTAPQVEIVPELGASDAELAALTKKMESGISAAFSGLGLGGTVFGAMTSASQETGKEGDSAENEGAISGNSVQGPGSNLSAMKRELEAGVTTALSGFGLRYSATEDTGETGNNSKKETAVSSAIWSTLESVSEMKGPPIVIGAGIGEWIEDLQKENEEKDPHKSLKESLDKYLKEQPCGKYEGWVEQLLMSEGWDEESAVVDVSFYMEKSVHRNVWNDRNIQDGIGADEGETKRAYVPARGSKQTENKSTKATNEDGEEEEEEIFFT